MGRFVLHWAWVCTLGAAPLVGCTDVVETVTLSVTTTEAPSLDADIFGGPPLGGVELCQTDTTNCRPTDPLGRASIPLPANQEVSYTVEKEGYVPYLVGDVTDGSFLDSTWPMVSDELMASGSEILGLPYPWMGGVIELRPLPAMAGLTFDLADEMAVGYYRDETGNPSLVLTATTSNGGGGFLEVPPDEHQVEFGGAAINCVPSIAWPGNAANRVKVRVRAGYFAYASVTCDAL